MTYLELSREVDSQRYWMKLCGGDRAGYVAKYHGTHGRTIENALEIYKADKSALESLEHRLSRRVRR